MPPRAETNGPIAASSAKTPSVEPQPVIDRELLLIEAEWVWSEMEDFVRQIQRYRLTYVTALFASIGWVLGHLVDPANAAFSLDQIRANPAIASVILLIPMLNGLFFILVMESARQLQSLARYRFLLGCALEGVRPAWRWELFKLTKEGSIRSWTTPSNIFLGVFALFASIGAFLFVNPAVGNAVVNVLRWVSGTYTAALAVAVIWAGWTRRHENDVADEPIDTTYEALRPSWAARLNRRAEPGQS
jgi:hypothetical protein